MEKKYKIVYITRKGKRRKLVTYNKEEQKEKHIKIKKFLDNKLYFSQFTKAYIKNASIYKNVKAHMYNDIFFKFDIKHFFENIDHKILLRILHKELNRNNNKPYSILEVAELIRECIASEKGLPLGLITSPILANIYLKEFDNILYGKLKKMDLLNVIYTRYADDLTISFKDGTSNLDPLIISDIKESIEEEIVTLLNRYKLKLNKKKTSVVNLNISNHVRITGISIIKSEQNYRRLSVGKKKIAELYDDAIEIYKKKFIDSAELTANDFYEIQRIKGLQSFILSIHKKGYENMLSNEMIHKVKALGFLKLEDLIKSLDKNI